MAYLDNLPMVEGRPWWLIRKYHYLRDVKLLVKIHGLLERRYTREPALPTVTTSASCRLRDGQLARPLSMAVLGASEH